MKRLNYFTKGEIILWASSAMLIVLYTALSIGKGWKRGKNPKKIRADLFGQPILF